LEGKNQTLINGKLSSIGLPCCFFLFYCSCCKGVSGVRRLEDRRRKTEDRGTEEQRNRGRKTEEQRTEDRGQRTEDRGQRTEDGGQRTEDGRRKTEERRNGGIEDRGQRAEGRGQTEEKVDLGSQMRRAAVSCTANIAEGLEYIFNSSQCIRRIYGEGISNYG